MFSILIKVIIVLVGFSPALLSLYISKLIQSRHTLSFYIEFSSVEKILAGLINLISTHLLLLIFILVLLLARSLINLAKNKLPIGRIQLKSIKPADINFLTLLFSVILPFFRLAIPNASDVLFLTGFVLIAILYALILKSSYHFNLVFRFFLGYMHYEVQTSGEVTYLMISKKPITNKKQVSEYIYLTDYMLLNPKA